VVEPPIWVRSPGRLVLDRLVDDANKKNPDPASWCVQDGAGDRELTGMLTLLKGLPLAYQKDMQEDKPPLFDAAATLEASLGVMAGMVATLAVDRDRMRRGR